MAECGMAECGMAECGMAEFGSIILLDWFSLFLVGFGHVGVCWIDICDWHFHGALVLMEYTSHGINAPHGFDPCMLGRKVTLQ